MISWYTGSILLGSAALSADPTYTTGGIAIAGLTFIGIFIKHQQMEIKRLTERLDEAKARSEQREVQIAELRHELNVLKQTSPE